MVTTINDVYCQKKTAAFKNTTAFCTEGRDRTGTSVTSLVFETNASTDSATSAWRAQKYTFFDFPQQKNFPLLSYTEEVRKPLYTK